MGLPPEQLRVAADAYDKKGDRLFDLNRIEEANKCWDRAIDLRQRAICIEAGVQPDAPGKECNG